MFKIALPLVALALVIAVAYVTAPDDELYAPPSQDRTAAAQDTSPTARLPG